MGVSCNDGMEHHARLAPRATRTLTCGAGTPPPAARESRGHAHAPGRGRGHGFNRVGYGGTDSNRIARAAGYAPGTFYKHFSDKPTSSWPPTRPGLPPSGTRSARSYGGATTVPSWPHAWSMRPIDLHCRWRGLRASLRVLVAEGRHRAHFLCAPTPRQLALLAALDGPRGGRRPREADAFCSTPSSGVCDAIADGSCASWPLAPADGQPAARADRAAARLSSSASGSPFICGSGSHFPVVAVQHRIGVRRRPPPRDDPSRVIAGWQRRTGLVQDGTPSGE
jgi:hypothetical protein